MIITEPVPFDEAAKLIRNKPPLTRELFDAAAPELQAAAFVITGVEDLAAIERVQNLTAALPEGADWDTQKREIADELESWLGDRDSAERRAELLLRSHAFAAYSQMNYRSLEEESDIFTWRKYQTAQDERVRGAHAALNGVVLPASSPFWKDHTPPWDFGCRCDVIGLTDDDVDEVRFQLAKQTKIAKTELMIIEPGSPELEGIEKGYIYRDGQMNFVTRDPESYSFDPAGQIITVEMLEGMKSRVGAHAWNKFVDWAKGKDIDDNGSVWAWLAGQWKKPTPKAKSRPRPKAKTKSIPKPPPAPKDKAGKKTAAPKKKKPSARVQHIRKHPPVGAVFPATRSTAKPAIDSALDAIESVHGDGVLPTLKLRGFSGSKNPGLYGEFGVTRWVSRTTGETLKRELSISIRTDGPHKELTAVHEIGHFLAAFGLGDESDIARRDYKKPDTAIGKWWKAIEDSGAFRGIDDAPFSKKHKDYLKMPEEAFARSYAQYIATKTKSKNGGLLRDQLARVRKTRAGVTQWSDEEFEPIAKAMDEILKEKDWLRPE